MNEQLRAADHDRARELAAARQDELLAPRDEAWLADHLDACTACAAVAAAYDAQHDLFADLRAAAPLAPRDLWARTSSAIDAERGSRSRPWRRVLRSPRRGSRLALAPAMAALAVAVALGAGLLNGSLGPTGGAAATPIALAAADVQLLSRDADGNMQILTRTVDAVCPIGVSTCGVSPTFAVTAVSGIAPSSAVQGALSPAQDRLVVVARDAAGEGVYILPVRVSAASASATAPASGSGATASQPITTTPPAASATTAAAATQSPSASTPPTPATGTPAPATSSPAPTAASPTASTTAPPASDASVTPTPATTDAAPTLAAPTSLASGSPAPTDAASASPVETAVPGDSASSAAASSSAPLPSVAVTPGPDAAIQIASKVTVVSSPLYAPDGNRVAFAAMPSDGSAGPDIYVWAAGDKTATAITSDHASWLAAWTAAGIIVSRVADRTPSTFVVNPATGESTPVGGPGTWLPEISPSGAQAVWWSGTVKLASDGVTWIPDAGSVVMGAWPSGAAGTVPQALTKGQVAAWQADWSEAGDVAAVWVDPSGTGHAGKLSLFHVDAATGVADLANPMLDAVPANPDFSLRSGRLAWTTPSEATPRVVEVLAWSGKAIGRLELPADGSGTVVP